MTISPAMSPPDAPLRRVAPIALRLPEGREALAGEPAWAVGGRGRG